MKHIAVITKKPVLTGHSSTPDGAYTGNGDIGLVIGNYEEGLRIYISKSDLYELIESHNKGGMKPLGYIDIPIKKELYDNYRVLQDMDKGEIDCIFEKDGERCEILIRANKTENSIMLESFGSVPIKPVMKVYEGETSGKKDEGGKGDFYVIYRGFDSPECVAKTHCYAAMKKINENIFYAFVATNHDLNNSENEGVVEYVIGKVRDMNKDRYLSLRKKHYGAWKSYWEKSSFECEDESLEMGWYASNYILACCSGNKKFPPGLCGNFVTVEHPMWHSDYHLNYNYQAPFYGTCSSNHTENTDCYMAPLEEFIPKGREFAAKFGCRGIILPTGIEPKGVCSEYDPSAKNPFERLFLGQKSNQLHTADIIIERWKTTRDLAFAREKAYPYLKECLAFFESYLTKEGDRLSVTKDAIHEVPMYRDDFDPTKFKFRFVNDKNNSLTLGLLRLSLEAAIDMSQALSVDSNKREEWEYILKHLSPFKTCHRHFRKIFRYTEKGQAWNSTNDCGLQHIYPGNYVGILSDPETLKIARNTFRQKERTAYSDDNAVTSFFPMAARLGINPDKIIEKLKEYSSKVMGENMLFVTGAGAAEYSSLYSTTLNEMAMQSFQGAIILFPNWSKGINLSFRSLRAYGAFTVSSSIIKGRIGDTEIISEKGEILRVVNPFEKALVSYGNSKSIFTGRIIEIQTTPGMKIRIAEV